MKTSAAREQDQRMRLEYGLIRKFIPSFRMLEADSDVYAEGFIQSSVGTRYRARVMLPDAYPDEQPQALIIDPHPVLTRDRQQALNSMGTAHAFHIRGASPDGFLMPCLFGSWHPSFPIVKVVLKLCIWVEAYENYLRTGEDIATFLHH